MSTFAGGGISATSNCYGRSSARPSVPQRGPHGASSSASTASARRCAARTFLALARCRRQRALRVVQLVQQTAIKVLSAQRLGLLLVRLSQLRQQELLPRVSETYVPGGGFQLHRVCASHQVPMRECFRPYDWLCKCGAHNYEGKEVLRRVCAWVCLFFCFLSAGAVAVVRSGSSSSSSSSSGSSSMGAAAAAVTVAAAAAAIIDSLASSSSSGIIIITTMLTYNQQ